MDLCNLGIRLLMWVLGLRKEGGGCLAYDGVECERVVVSLLDFLRGYLSDLPL